MNRDFMARVFAACLLCAGFVALAHAQFLSPSQTVVLDAPFKVASGGGGYSGPGDVQASGWLWWHGLRCFSNAYAGAAFLITDSATGNTTASKLNCSGGTLTAAAGANCAGPGVSGNACSPVATTCATACNVYELFDQSGQTNCSAAACNAVQATNADRPVFTSSACSGLSGSNQTWCMSYAAQTGGTFYLIPANTYSGATVTQPYLVYCANKWGTNGGNAGCESASGKFYLAMENGSNFALWAGTADGKITGASTGTWYAFQAVANGASTVLYENGTNLGSPATNPGTSAINGGFIQIPDDGFGDGCACTWLEGGANSALSAPSSALNTNTRNYWGF